MSGTNLVPSLVLGPWGDCSHLCNFSNSPIIFPVGHMHYTLEKATPKEIITPSPLPTQHHLYLSFSFSGLANHLILPDRRLSVLKLEKPWANGDKLASLSNPQASKGAL